MKTKKISFFHFSFFCSIVFYHSMCGLRPSSQVSVNYTTNQATRVVVLRLVVNSSNSSGMWHDITLSYTEPVTRLSAAQTIPIKY